MNKFLGTFIENIDTNQVGSSLLSGKLTLTNMRLRRTMFDASPLPFQLEQGFVGRIHLKIPVWDMFKSPLVIEISDVFGFVKFKPKSKWLEKQQMDAYRQFT